MMFVKDYRLVTLFNSSLNDFETYLSGWLLPAITDFKTCDQSLAYSSDSFSSMLTEEMSRSCVALKKYWLKKEIVDITQINLHVKRFRVLLRLIFQQTKNVSGRLRSFSNVSIMD
jgi:hypothetical protein